jgi:8-oxo-dGTP diphosphatase
VTITKEELVYACSSAVEEICAGSKLHDVILRMVNALQTQRPLVGICVLVVKNGKILLGKRRGSHGAGEYAAPGGHLEHLESFDACASREVLEETGLVIGPPRLLRVENVTAYAPKHYVDLAFVAEWISGEPAVCEPDKVERWDWYALDDLPAPLFAMLPSAIAAWQADP